MKRQLLLVPAIALLYACGGDGSTGPGNYGPPVLVSVNGATSATGLIGMTVILEGTEFGTQEYGSAWFMAEDGSPIEATVNAGDWTNTYVVTTVPQGTAAASKVWIETFAGVTERLDFLLADNATFNPANISWTRTTDLPQALQGLGAAFVSVDWGSTPAKYIFTLGGATDGANVATSAVYRGTVLETGAIDSWSQSVTQLSGARAYHATAVATPYNAPVDNTFTAGYLYVIGGIDANGATVNTILYARVGLDGNLGSWQSAGTLPAALHSSAAVVYRGFLYVTGGANSQNVPSANAYRAAVRPDGTLGAWQSMPALPQPTAHHSIANFGPYLYVVGGDSSAVEPVLNTETTKEINAALLGRIDMRTGAVAPWVNTSTPEKVRSKHGLMSAGGSIVITSGVYPGFAGSSENAYALINADGTLSSWNGATGGSTIVFLLGYSLYNQAAISFVDATGKGHVVVLGGADRATAGKASAAVVYY